MSQKHIDEIRSFNRFYTDIIGLVDQYILNSKYTLPEVRIMYELYHHENIRASEIVSRIHIDKGYLSRMLVRFEKKKLISKKVVEHDGRSSLLFLTQKGKKEFEKLNLQSDKQIASIIQKIPAHDHDQLLYHLAEIKKIFQHII